MAVCKGQLVNQHLSRNGLVTLGKSPMVGTSLTTARRRYLLKTGGRPQKVVKTPLESLFTTRTLSDSGSGSVPSLISLQEDEQFGYVDAMEVSGLKAPKSRTGYQVMKINRDELLETAWEPTG